MSKKIKFLTGRYLYVELPPKPNSKIIVDENTKEALHKTMLKELRVLTVFAKGELVSDKISIGDKVLVDPSALSSPSVVIIPLENNQGEEKIVALIQDYQIIHVWE
jgi:hypothetical protein